MTDEEMAEKRFYVYKMSGHYYTIDVKPVYEKVLFEGTEKECYEFVKKELEEQANDTLKGAYDYYLRKENFSLKQKNQMLEKKLEKVEKLLTDLFNTAIGYGNEEYHKRTIEEYKQFIKEIEK